MRGFHLTVRARSDLASIGRYTEKMWGREQRNKCLAQIDECFHMLADNPSLGRSCDWIVPGYARYYIGKHVVFYRVAGDGIEIIRLLHERMGVTAHIRAD